MLKPICQKIKDMSKKYIYILLFFIIFSLSICTIVMYKKNINNNVIVKDFIRITKNLNKKNKDIINNKILFLKRRNSIYTTLVGINLSKQLFLKKKYIESTRILKKLLLVNSEENLLFLIKLNLLKLYIKQNKFSKAINIIASIQDSSWKKLFEKYNKIYFNKKRILA